MTDGSGGTESQVLLKQGSLYTFSAAAPLLVTLLVTPVLTRSLAPSEYGVVAIALVINQIGLVVLSFGLQEPIARHGIMESSGIAGAKALIVRALVPALALTGLTLWSAPLWLGWIFGTPFRPAHALAILSALVFSVIAEIQAVMRAMNRPLPVVIMAILASLLAPVIGLGLVLLLGPSAESYMLGTVLGYCVSLAYGITVFLRGERPQHARGDLRRALRLGIPMIPHQVAIYLAQAVVVACTSTNLGVADAGRMQLTMYVGTAPAMIAVALSNSWGPLLYRTVKVRRQKVATQLASDVSTVIAVLSIGLCMVLPVLLPLLMPVGYDPRALIAPATIAVIGSMPFIPYAANVHLMMVEGRNAALSVIIPAAFAASVALALGARFDTLPLLAATSGIAMLLMAVGTRLVLPRITSYTWSARAVIPQLVLVAVIGGLSLLLDTSAGGLGVRLVVAVVTGLVGLKYLRSVFGAGTASANSAP